MKVALTGAKRIRRRVAIRGDRTLEKLGEAIFEAFDRYDPHLSSFYFPGPGSRGRERLRGWGAPEFFRGGANMGALSATSTDEGGRAAASHLNFTIEGESR